MKNTVLVLSIFVLSACQNIPTTDSTTAQESPAADPHECPVCEVRQCPEPQVIERVVTEYVPTPEVSRDAKIFNNSTPVIGALELVKVEPSDFVFEARIDTGAETSAIHAENIRLVEKDGKRYVQYSLRDPETSALIPFEQRLHRRIRVKHNVDDEAADRRYVVRMWLTLGDSRNWVDVSLSDREGFDFPVLIGRNMLTDNFVVDVSKRHTTSISPPVSK